jgi:hypothetical protein
MLWPGTGRHHEIDKERLWGDERLKTFHISTDVKWKWCLENGVGGGGNVM